MKPIIYQIEFFSFWHVSSGLSGSTYADMLTNKTRQGLPFIPGKTLKGLLRDAAEQIHELNHELVNEEFITTVFGEQPNKDRSGNEVEAKTEKSTSFFTNATLSESVSRAILSAQKEKIIDKKHLFQVISSTSLDKNGIAKDGTLRQMEVTVPMILYASIEGFPDKPDYLKQLNHCFQWIKQMGMNRSRGLGRCQFSIYQPSSS